VDLPVDAHIPPDYVTSDRLRLEAYRKTAAATDVEGLSAVLDELVDRYGAPPEPVENLMAVARLRLLCREHGVTEVTTAGTQLKVGPLDLLDSQQLRLKRLHPGAQWKPTSKVVALPLPRAGSGGIGSGRLRDVDLLQFVADLLLQLAGTPKGSVDVSVVTARVHEKV
jgi:transcription-repair coupling factor (superfamily II helicase)